jgi:hypothetical protein
MNIKALLGTAVVVLLMSYVTNMYLYLPLSNANPAPGVALLPLWGSLAAMSVVWVLLLDWVNKRVKHAVQSALIIAVSQIALVDVYYVLNGTRSVTAAAASAATLLIIWVTGGVVYGKLNSST